ncbi:hypothetical protein [Limosilactobacillus ingluviei]|uniref:Polysaccharide polymerase n=1 Tax=Limosilactobacillus ingluviei TaxID=148604 RepID=A0A0R2GXN1_9LACO|nr:hypothetical protein [Limosilactobacillus ingluviei]KRN45519.1 hypothetical protein IV41_GL000737 [Limosilactobacillus ingluviei]
MKVKKTTIVFYLSCILFFVSNTNIFYLFPLSGIFSGTSNNTLSSIAGLFIFAMSIFYVNGNGKKYYVGKFSNSIILFFIIFVVTSFHSIYSTGFTPKQIFINLMAGYLILLLYYPLMNLLSDEDKYRRFIFVGELFYDLLGILFLIQYILLARSGIYILKISELIISGQYMRIYGVFEGFIRIFILMIGYEIFKTKKRKNTFHVVSLIILLLSVLLIDQSRYYIITLILCLLIDYLYINKGKISVGKMLFSIVVIPMAMMLLVKFATSISNSVTLNDGGYTNARTGGYAYYWELFRSNILFGIGAANPDKWTPVWYLERGPQGIYHLSDVGIVGTLTMFGILILFWLIYVLLKMIKLCTITVGVDQGLSLSILIMMLLALPLNSYLDSTRVMSLLLSITIIELNYLRNITSDLEVKTR